MPQIKDQDSLFFLIQRLEASEKRAFKLQVRSNMRKGESLHDELYEFLLQQEEPDEEALQAHFAGQLDAHQLSAAKNRLHRFLLKVLAQFHTASEEEAKLQQGLHALRILREKQLPEQALKLLNSLEKQAARCDRHGILLDLNLHRLQLLAIGGGKGRIEAQRAADTRHLELAAILQQEAVLHATVEFIQALVARENRVGSAEQALEFEQIESRPALQGPPLSFLSGLLQAHVRSIIAFARGDFAAALQTYGESSFAWEERPELIPLHSDLYMRYQLNHLNACLISRQAAEFQRVLAVTKARLPQLRGNPLQHERRIYYLELIFCLNYGNEAQDKALMGSLEPWLDLHSRFVEDQHLLPLLHNCAIFHFLHSQYRPAIRFLNRIRNIPKTPRHLGIQSFAPIFEIVLHYELGNMDYVESRLRAATRNPRKLSAYHKLITRFFKKLEGLSGPSELRERLVLLREALQKAAQPIPPTGHHEILFWLQSRIDGIPVRQIYQEALAGRKEGG